MHQYIQWAVVLLLAGPAAAQIAPLSPAQQRAANRQALRDASRTEAPYKESHLTVTPAQLERGNTQGPPGMANVPRQHDEKRPRPGHKLLGRRRPKTEPTP